MYIRLIRTAAISGLTIALFACGGPSTGDLTAEYVESVVQEARSEALARGKAGSLSSFAVNVESTDRYGNADVLPALRFSWAAADLERVNWSNISDYQLLDLASVAITGPDGVRALSEWCDMNGEVLTPRFCNQARTSAITIYVNGTAGP